MVGLTDCYLAVPYLLLGELTPLVGVNKVIVPFLACGDLSGFDSDKSYPTQVSTACTLYNL